MLALISSLLQLSAVQELRIPSSSVGVAIAAPTLGMYLPSLLAPSHPSVSASLQPIQLLQHRAGGASPGMQLGPLPSTSSSFTELCHTMAGRNRQNNMGQPWFNSINTATAFRTAIPTATLM
uniref:Uncharacterized protein n=1 Tax=Coccolithus braarudii TaxID=221442 RepID=A0A7S0LRF5_9EUKA